MEENEDLERLDRSAKEPPDSEREEREGSTKRRIKLGSILLAVVVAAALFAYLAPGSAQPPDASQPNATGASNAVRHSASGGKAKTSAEGGSAPSGTTTSVEDGEAAESITDGQGDDSMPAPDSAGNGGAVASSEIASSPRSPNASGARPPASATDGGQTPGSAGSHSEDESAPSPEPPEPAPNPAPEPAPPAHAHYFEPIMGDVCWCDVANPSPDHMKNHRLAGECGPDGLNNVQNNVITGYRPCSCGATM